MIRARARLGHCLCVALESACVIADLPLAALAAAARAKLTAACAEGSAAGAAERCTNEGNGLALSAASCSPEPRAVSLSRRTNSCCVASAHASLQYKVIIAYGV